MSLVNEKSTAQTKRKPAKNWSVVAVIAILIATLWPLNPIARNGVTWLREGAGLKFENAGVVISSQPLRILEAQADKGLSLELFLQPAYKELKCTILTFYVPFQRRQFLVRQHGESLIVTHDPAFEVDVTKTTTFELGHYFSPGKLVLLTISSGANGTTVYSDGRIVGLFPNFKISRSELEGQIVLGTSAMNFAPWEGQLRGLAIYSKELGAEDALRHYKEWTAPSGTSDLDRALARYTFGQTSGREIENQVAAGPKLEIQATFSVPHKDFLEPVAKEFRPDWKYAINMSINIAGFVPLGLVICAYFSWTKERWQAVLLTTVACGTLSLMIEILQYYIPRRGSGLTDVITNTLGAGLGAVLTQTDSVCHLLQETGLVRRIGE